MAKYEVIFHPEGKKVEVEEGVTLLEAANKAGVYINSLCGGEGLCGECRLRVITGNARADKNAIGFFSGEEIKNGYVLAQISPGDGTDSYRRGPAYLQQTGEAIPAQDTG